MSTQVREHRAPTRYSIRKAERQEVADYLLRHNSITTDQIRKFSDHFGCAQKVIHAIAETMGFEVLCVDKPARPDGPKVSPGGKRGNGIEPVVETGPPTAPRSLHHDTQTEPDHAEGDADEKLGVALDLLAEEETRLQKSYEDRCARLQADFDDLMSELEEERGRVEAEQVRTREAIAQTRALRLATRQDREDLETARGEIGVLKRAVARAEKERERTKERNRELRKDLRDMVALCARLEAAIARDDVDTSTRDLRIIDLEERLSQAQGHPVGDPFFAAPMT